MKVNSILDAIKNRQSVFPQFFSPEPVEEKLIHTLMEIANTAPTHRLTEPWRFVVFSGGALKRLGKYLADEYKSKNSAEFSETKFKKRYDKAIQSSHVIAIVMQRDLRERVPEWEEIAAVSCAVQNLWIAANAMGLGGYWSTPAEILGRPSILNLGEGQRCLGLFYLGNHQLGLLAKIRGDYREKVRFINS